VKFELLRGALEAALVDACEQLLERAHVRVTLKIVAGHPDAEHVPLVERGVGAHLGGVPFILERALEGQELLPRGPRTLDGAHVLLKLGEERVRDQPIDRPRVGLLLLLAFLLTFLVALLVVHPWLVVARGKKGGEIGVCATLALVDAHRAARAVGGVALQRHCRRRV